MDALLDELLLETPRLNTTKRPLAAVYERDLNEADLVALRDEPRGAVPPSLVRIHSSHHALARCLATGMRTYDAALVTGYSPARINQLEHDPLFIDLVENYRREAISAVADVVQRMQCIHKDALELLHERLLEKPEEFSTGLLLDTVKTFADRTGHGPNAQVNLNVTAGAVDRPPRETQKEWLERRQKELEAKAEEPTLQ